MAIQISEYVDVTTRAAQLGCNIPAGLACLPMNFDIANSRDELVYEDTVLTVRKLWRQAGIVETRIENEGEKIPTEQRKSLEWVSPIIFVSVSLLSQNADAVSIGLNVISTYLTDFFKGIVGDKKVTFDIVVEQVGKKRSKRIHYEGSLEGVDELRQVMKEIKEL